MIGFVTWTISNSAGVLLDFLLLTWLTTWCWLA